MNKLESKLKDLNKMLIEDGYNGRNIVIQTLEEIREEAFLYKRRCTELRDKETPKIEDWLKDNFKRLDRHSFTNIHEDIVWLRSELVEVYNQLHP